MTNEFSCQFSLIRSVIRSKMRHLSEVQVARAVALIQHGHSMLAGTFEFPLLLFSVYGIGFGRLANMLERAGQGRNRKTTQNQDRFLVLS
jgi:hypothetical protein